MVYWALLLKICKPFVMRQKFKNSRQKAQRVVIHTCKLFNALVLNFCHNPKGYCQFWHIAMKKSSEIAVSIPLNFSLLSAKIGLVANDYKSSTTVPRVIYV